jgi:hypothetical protein
MAEEKEHRTTQLAPFDQHSICFPAKKTSLAPHDIVHYRKSSAAKAGKNASSLLQEMIWSSCQQASERI